MKSFVLDASVALGWTLDNPVPASNPSCSAGRRRTEFCETKPRSSL